MTEDLNDQFKAGKLPSDPAQGGKVMSVDVPRVHTVQELLHDSYQRALTPKQQQNLLTGHWEMDRITGGFRPGFVWVFGADTSWGKSSWLIMVADENIRAKRRVLIVSAEDDKSLYGDRLLLRRSRVSADNFKAQTFTLDERTQLEEAARKGEDQPVYLDARGRSVEWVAARTKELIKEHQIDLVAWDYLQAFDSDKRHQDRRNQVTYVARTLTDVTKLAGIAGIQFSQITMTDGKAHPDKHCIRESRDVANAAEVVALGFTPDKPIKRKVDSVQIADAGERCVFLDKVKDGPRGGLCRMAWDNKSACFNVVIQDPSHRANNQRPFDDVGEPPDDPRFS